MNRAFLAREVAPEELRGAVHEALTRPGWRYGHLTAMPAEDGTLRIAVLLLDGSGGGKVLLAPLAPDASEFPSLSPQLPAAHWAERAVGDLFGLQAAGHPRWKPLLLHEAWPAGLAPLRGGADVGGRGAYEFLAVEGEEVHEIPVGPIHAGIIEPGHFRFSCLGEIVTNLEIRLGYQHRGLERGLAEVPWRQARFLAESASSDTAAGNALAHAAAVEQLLGVEAPARAAYLRTMALEVERVANHLGDLGGLSADIGYAAGASVFARLRGVALGLGELLAGNRLQRWYVVPGGVARDLDRAGQERFAEGVHALSRAAEDDVPLLLEHPSALSRMEGVGRLQASLAREFGMVGPAARASGGDYDARQAYRHGVYPQHAPPVARRESGDVLARAQVRAAELQASLGLLAALAATLPDPPALVPVPDALPRTRMGIGIVEAWRGELIHWIATDDAGRVARYTIKDPSFNNWTGLAIAVRGNLVADFPLCNKSFNLSYCGNDL